MAETGAGPGTDFGPQVWIQQPAIVIRAVHFAMAFHTVKRSPFAAMSGHMAWGSAVALLTQHIIGSAQKPVVGTAVGHVTRNTAATAFSRKTAGGVVLVQEWTAFHRVTADAIG